MDLQLLVPIGIFVVAAVLLIAYLRRLLRRSREIEKHLDYSKMREWRDDDEDEDDDR